MKKAAVFFGALLCSLSLSAASGQAPAPVPTLADFVATLGSVDVVPEPALKNHCSATWNCPVGFQLFCTGHTLCEAAPNFVKCDGVQQNCPVCTRTKTCCDGSVIQCFGFSSCQTGPPRCVTCDGVTQDCCPPLSSCF